MDSCLQSNSDLQQLLNFHIYIYNCKPKLVHFNYQLLVFLSKSPEILPSAIQQYSGHVKIAGKSSPPGSWLAEERCITHNNFPVWLQIHLIPLHALAPASL